MGFLSDIMSFGPGLQGAYENIVKNDANRRAEAESMLLNQMRQQQIDDITEKRRLATEYRNAISGTYRPVDMEAIQNQVVQQKFPGLMATPEERGVNEQYGGWEVTPEDRAQAVSNSMPEIQAAQAQAQQRAQQEQLARILPVIAQYDPERYAKILQEQQDAQRAGAAKYAQMDYAHAQNLELEDKRAQNRLAVEMIKQGKRGSGGSGSGKTSSSSEIYGKPDDFGIALVVDKETKKPLRKENVHTGEIIEDYRPKKYDVDVNATNSIWETAKTDPQAAYNMARKAGYSDQQIKTHPFFKPIVDGMARLSGAQTKRPSLSDFDR